jgi:hypothetical protein
MLVDSVFAAKNPVEFKLATALQRYYAARYPNIVDLNEFVRTHPKFLALVMFTDPREQYRTQGFDVTPLEGPKMPEGERFYLVEKRM